MHVSVMSYRSYVSPEAIRKESGRPSCDIWSCGVILYILLSGRAPFTGKPRKKLFENIQAGSYSMEGRAWEKVSENAKVRRPPSLTPPLVPASAPPMYTSSPNSSHILPHSPATAVSPPLP